MKVMLLLHGDEAAWTSKSPEEIEVAIQPYFAYTQMLIEKGHMVVGHELTPSTSARMLTKKGGERIWDGPFTDTKEQLGGYYVLEVADMEEALRLAALCPQAEDGVVEVRPVIEHDPS